MPTYEREPEFLHDLERLTPEMRKAFEAAVQEFVEDLKAKRQPRVSLGIERFHRRRGAWEFHFSGNGRALFAYGKSPHEGDIHIIWLAIGTHDIYKR